MGQSDPPSTDRYGTPRSQIELVDALWPSGIHCDPFHDESPHALVVARHTLSLRNGENAYLDRWPGHRVFVNGPYSGSHPAQTARRVALERERGTEILNLCPAAPGSDYWSRWVWPWCSAVAWLGRLPFIALTDIHDKSGRLVCKAGKTRNGNRTEIAMLYYGEQADRFVATWRGAGYAAQVNA